MSLTVVEKTLEQLLPIQAVTYTLAFNQPVTFRFFHETSLTAFIRTIHKIDPVTLKEKLRIEALESGQVHYNKGDHYHFRVFSLSGDTDILFQITKSLYEASKKSVKSNQGKPLFQGGYTLIAQHDGLSGKRIDSHTELEKYTASSLDEDASLLANTTQYALKFQSACLLTNKSGKNYCRDFNDVKQHNLLKRLLESQWRTLPAEQQKEFSVSKLSEQHQIPDYHPQSGHLVWFDIPYGPKKPNKRIDGLLGKLNLDALPVSQNNIWHKILILGQYLGLGGNINEGQGRYLIELLTQQGSAAIYYKPLPATSQLDRALTYTNINKAIEHTCRRPKDHSHIPYIKEILVKQLKNIRQHQYIVPPLTPVERHKDGKTRLLKIAPLDDRSIQRAVQQQLYKSFESLQHDQSFGYRLGLSRLNAKEHITSKIRELKRKGKQAWVFRSDINSFFDEISHQVARERLEMLYQDDPIIDLIMNWMAAPVQGATSSLENKGLPQGSPISPIVANLILDDFDNDMQHAGLNCIRFADDFVVITDSEKKAQKAQQAAKNSLAEHKITLNSKKTSIRSAADGFQFLGYTFVNDMALDTPRKNKVRYNQKTTQPTKEEDDAPQIKERPSLSYIGEQTAIGQSLIISGSSCLIKIQQNHIIVERDEQLIAESPIGQVQQILLFGQHYLTYPAQKAVLEHNIKLHYSRSGGKYIGSLQSGSPTLSQLNFWQKQRNLFGDEQATLYIVKQIITAKLAHSREVVRRYNERKVVDQLNSLITSINQKATSNRDVMSYEAQGATLYNQALRRYRPHDANYTHRHKQGAQDLFNILLNMGYATIRGYTTSFLSASGLAPSIGMLHKARGNHMALSSDLMEPFRYIVERVATTLLKRNIINHTHLEEKQGEIKLNAGGRRLFYTALSNQLETKRQPKYGGQKQTIIQHMQTQSNSLSHWVHSQEKTFNVWRMH